MAFKQLLGYTRTGSRMRSYSLRGICYNDNKYQIKRRYNTIPRGTKVTICGAAGSTGQPLALMLKQCPLIDEIALYDIVPTCVYALELRHIDTRCKVSSFTGQNMLHDALQGSSVVVIVARNECDTFENNAPILSEITLQICNTCPDSIVIVATEPVESLVPLVSEIQKLRNAYNPRKLFGCVELNYVRANTVLADFLHVSPEQVRLPVIGGAAPSTIVPLLSTAVIPCEMNQEQIECVTSFIMCGPKEVCTATGCTSMNASLAGAYAVARITINIVKGLQGEKNVVQCAYVDNVCAPYCQFFTNNVLLGLSGVVKHFDIPKLSQFECCLLYNSLPFVRNEIARAIWLVHTTCQLCCCNQPCVCYTPPSMICTPRTIWTCEYPDSCRGENLVAICREMMCK